MLGTGTQLDPYQITTVAGFRSMNDSTAYFKLMNDLDVNDSEWVSEWTEATILCKRIDFNGFELRNINCNNNSAFYTTSNIEFYNPKLKNIIIVGEDCCFCRLSSASYSAVFTGIDKNNNGQISMHFSGGRGSNGLLSSQGLKLSNIAGTIDAITDKFGNGLGETGATTYAGKTTSSNVHLKLNWHVTASTSGEILGGWGAGNSCSRTMITGKLSASSGATQSRLNLFDFGNGGAVSQCYCAAEFDNISNVTFGNSTFTPPTACFYDKDLLGTTMTAQTNVHALTTEQCKDKDYLNSIGFLVV